VRALLLHAPYLSPHPRLPTGIIACTNGSPVPVLALTPRFFNWRNGTRILLRLVPTQMGNGASLVPERCQNSAEPLERNKRLAERN
jgi:hypothetical protein